MAELRTPTPEGLTLRRELAGPGSRFVAAVLDGLVLAALYLVLLSFALLASELDPSGLSRFLVGVLAGGAILILIGYLWLVPTFWGGRTPGKRLLGLRTLSADGFPASGTQHLLRGLLWPVDVFLPIPMPFGLLGLLAILSSARRQRLGDLVAATVVLRERRLASVPPALVRPEQVASARLALQPGVLARLDGEDQRFLRDLLARRGLDPEDRRKLYVRAAAHYAEVLELGRFEDARVLLFALERELAQAAGAGGRAAGHPPAPGERAGSGT